MKKWMEQRMSELKKDEQKEDGRVSRRYFLELVGAGAIGTAAIGSGVLTVEYLSPNVLHEPPLKFKGGSIEDYPADSVTPIIDQKTYIVRAKGGYFYAMSSVCTHLGCITNWKSEEGIIACPCHGSKFNREGQVIEGPAPRPLLRYSLQLGERDTLLVDKGQIVSEETILKV